MAHVYDAAAIHHQTPVFKSSVYVSKKRFADVILFMKVAELQQCGGIRDLLTGEVNPHEGAHRVAVIDSLFDSDIREVEPALQKIHPEHCLNPYSQTASLA